MGENIKKEGRSKTCHNNCRIHHNPDFFNYYQYPYSPFYPYPTPPPVVQYTLPQNLYPPLLTQYHYSPIIQQPMPSQQQSPPVLDSAQLYQNMLNPNGLQNINQGSNLPSAPNLMSGSDGTNPSSYGNPGDYHNQQYLDDYYSPRYNSRPPASQGTYNNDFRRPVGPLSAEDEYNWAIHISEILDEFISRNRNQPRSTSGEYKELKNTLDTSLRHLKEAEALNKTLINAWEKRNEKQVPLPTVTSSETIILPETSVTDETEEVIKNDSPSSLNVKNQSEVKDTAKPEPKLKIDALSENNDFDLFNFDDDFDNHFDEDDDEHNFFFDNTEFNDPTTSIVDESKNNDTLNNSFTEDLNDFFDTNAPVIDLDPTKVEVLADDKTEVELKNSFTKGVLDTIPIQGTYKNYTINTLMGKIQAQDIYDKIFDELGHSKMDQFEVMNEFGLTPKQYDKLIDNFYQVKKNRNKKIDEKQIGVVIRSKFNVKAFWISMIVIGIILLLVGIVVILYFTVPSVANTIDMIINKIRSLF